MISIIVQGKEVLVDDDFQMPKGVISLNADGYARFWISGEHGRGAYVTLHRYVIGAKRGEIVDHKNRNIYDNRRDNLRICSASQNSAHRLVRGYTKHKSGRYQSAIRINGKQFYLGLFETAEEARAAYEKVNRVRGEFGAEICPLSEGITP